MTWKTLYTFQTWIESEKLSEDSKLLAEKSIEKWTFPAVLLLQKRLLRIYTMLLPISFILVLT